MTSSESSPSWQQIALDRGVRARFESEADEIAQAFGASAHEVGDYYREWKFGFQDGVMLRLPTEKRIWDIHLRLARKANGTSE